MNSIISATLWIIYIISLYFAIFWLLVYLDGGANSPKKKKLGNLPFITIAVPAFNEEKNIQETIESVLNLDYPKELFELIVIDDGSKDKTYEIAKKTVANYSGFNVQIISKKNEGKGVALNIALAKARGDFFTCLDGDSTIEPDAPKKLLSYFTSKNVAAVLPCMKVKNPKNLLQKLQWYEYIINMYYKKLMGHLNCVHVAPGPFSVYRTEVLRKLGGFATDNLTEDLEITYRLQKNNYEIIQVLDVLALTNTPEDLKSLYRQRNRWFKGSFLNSVDKNYRGMVFNKKYGDFGFIQLPIVITAGILSLILFSTAIYYGIKPYIVFMKNMYFVNFDIMRYFSTVDFHFYLIDLDYSLLLISAFMFVVSISFIYLAHKHTKEKVFKHGIFPLFVFMFFYYLYFGIVWAGVAYDLMKGKVQKW